MLQSIGLRVGHDLASEKQTKEKKQKILWVFFFFLSEEIIHDDTD